MMCIICNKNPETIWPKRWQCWKDNGKFSKSLCKLLGLPKHPYEDDFQNSVYCLSCQKRVYNVYLMVKKWEKLEEDVSKLKSELEKDFHESLQKGGNDLDPSKSKRDSGDGRLEAEPEGEGQDEDEDSVFLRMNKVRRRILKGLSVYHDHKTEWDCQICDGNNSGKDGLPSSQRSSCHKVGEEKINGGDDSNSNSSGCSYQDEDGDCSCCSSGKPQYQKSCSQDYCMDCSICNEKKECQNESEGRDGDDGSQNDSGNVSTDAQSPRQDSNFSTYRKESVSDVYNRKQGGDRENNPIAKEVAGSSFSINDCSSAANDGMGLEKEVDKFAMNSGYSSEDLLSYSERFRCFKSSCTRTFATKDELEIHIKRHHEGVKCPLVCQQCGKAFQWRRDLEAHRLKHSGEVAVCCHICGRGFRTKQLFNLHLKTKHAGERKHKCTQCEKSFISQSKLTTHELTHTKIYPFTCSICSKGFTAKTYLNFHMAQHMDSHPYQCTTCSKTFTTPRNLRVHQFTHTQSHPFKCEICQAGVTNETLLKKHMLKHNKEKSNVCQICNKRFTFPSSLKKHLMLHEGDKKPFICEFCNKTFMDKYKLTRHLRTHSGESPYQCYICEESFITKEYLNGHIRNHDKTFAEVSDTHQTDGDGGTSSEPCIRPSASTPLELHQMLHLQQQAYFPPSPSFPTVGMADHVENADALEATIQFDNLARPLTMDEAFGTEPQSQSTFTDLHASHIIPPTFQSHESSVEMFNVDFSSFSFQQL